VAQATTPLRIAQNAYIDTRGWAMSASTVRVRWRLRRLPRHSVGQQAQAKALRDELRDRGVVAP
jgi:hypothetical protein